MGIFELIIILVFISTIGKVASDWGRRTPPPPEPRPQLPPAEVERLQEGLDELNERVHRLEEERDFYRQLLENPDRERGAGPGDR